MFGEWALVKIKGRSPKGNEWLLMKHRDQYANPNVDITEVAPRSVVSNLDVDAIGAERIWVSNRKATGGRGAPTLASRLVAEQAKAAPVTKKRPAKARAPSAHSSA